MVLTENILLDSLIKVISLVHSMLRHIGIGLSDTEEWLAYYPGTKIDIGARKGMKIKPNEPLADCISMGKLIRQEVAAEFFGFPFTRLAVPIVEGNQVIGAVAIQLQE